MLRRHDLDDGKESNTRSKSHAKAQSRKGLRSSGKLSGFAPLRETKVWRLQTHWQKTKQWPQSEASPASILVHTSQPTFDIIAAHKASSWHRSQITVDGVVCGCFHCCQIFSPSLITEWVDENAAGDGQTAMCPLCGIDSVIGSSSGYPITTEFLGRMKVYWFGAE